MLDQQHRKIAAQAVDQSGHGLRLLRAHARQRLVQQDQLRVSGQRHADFKCPLLAVRQLLDTPVVFGCQTQALKLHVCTVEQCPVRADWPPG